MQLRNLIEPHLDLPRLSKDLDEIGTPARIWATRQWSRADQAALYEAAKGFRAVTLDDYVPAGTEPLVEVVTHGTNTMPTFRHFQKRFCKPADPETKDQLVGFNRQTFRAFTGPGYYVAHRGADEGEVDIDYSIAPTERAETWPEIAPNSARLGRFVYEGMVDVMRGISSHVSIGRAKKTKGWLDVWFVLVREDPQPVS